MKSPEVGAGQQAGGSSAQQLVQKIKEEHREVDQLYVRFQSVSENAQKEKIAHEIVMRIAQHSGREIALYPALRLIPGLGDDDVDYAQHQHRAVTDDLARQGMMTQPSKDPAAFQFVPALRLVGVEVNPGPSIGGVDRLTPVDTCTRDAERATSALNAFRGRRGCLALPPRWPFALSCALGLLLMLLSYPARPFLLLLLSSPLLILTCFLVCCVWPCTSWRCVRVPVLLLAAVWAPTILWLTIDGAGCHEGDPFPYPQLVRGELERWRAQTGSYPRTAAELARLARDRAWPTVPPVFTEEFRERCQMGTMGYYVGNEEAYMFSLDWGFIGPLGATYSSKESRWRQFS